MKIYPGTFLSCSRLIHQRKLKEKTYTPAPIQIRCHCPCHEFPERIKHTEPCCTNGVILLPCTEVFNGEWFNKENNK